MRILQITDIMHPGSGIAQLLLSYNQFINNNRIQFDYIVESCDEKLKTVIRDLGGEVYIMPKLILSNVCKFKNFFDTFFQEHNYTIVHSHYYQIDFLVMLSAYDNGVKHYISHSHNPKYSDFVLKSIRNFVLSIPIRFMATEFCACSQPAGEFLYGRFILKCRKKTLYVLPNAINYLSFQYKASVRSDLRKRLGLSNELTIGIVGSLRPQKNQIFLLAVVKYIFDNYDPNIKCIMVGDGISREVLSNEIKNYGLENNVIITGFTDRAREYYNVFDCYVLPSVYEGFGLSLLEAQVNSLRCVCSTAVPLDPIISEHVIRMPLSQGVKTWSEVIYSSANKGRFKDSYSQKYNVEIQASGLEEYYRNLV